MDTEGSSPHSQQPATCPYPEPDPSSTNLSNTTSRTSILVISSHLRLSLLSGGNSYKTTGEIIIACILTFIFLDSKLKHKRFCTEW